MTTTVRILELLSIMSFTDKEIETALQITHEDYHQSVNELISLNYVIRNGGKCLITSLGKSCLETSNCLQVGRLS